MLTKELGFPSPPDLNGAMGLHSYHYDTHPGQNFILLLHHAPLNHIAHEVLHAVEVIDGWYGIHSKEYRAYLQGYLTEEIYKFVNKDKNGKWWLIDMAHADDSYHWEGCNVIKQ